MAIVSKINIANSQLNNCDDIAKCFTDMITNKTEDCDQFRVEFDRYDPKSLKNKLRSNETEGLSAVHYKVSDTARIIHRLTKQSLSSILTYNKEYVTVHGNSLLINEANLNKLLENYNEEEQRTPALSGMQ